MFTRIYCSSVLKRKLLDCLSIALRLKVLFMLLQFGPSVSVCFMARAGRGGSQCGGRANSAPLVPSGGGVHGHSGNGGRGRTVTSSDERCEQRRTSTSGDDGGQRRGGLK
ncbi:hypothetical protein M569_05130 [Genlisea aurea]|uniref:Uncharacterized protein n=1 Tax=Genlisea aurea TaxID=192259 RepID=S8CXB6_9LAMI|nr:hypothetical protein M569_05130 [Genlisea aurea]